MRKKDVFYDGYETNYLDSQHEKSKSRKWLKFLWITLALVAVYFVTFFLSYNMMLNNTWTSQNNQSMKNQIEKLETDNQSLKQEIDSIIKERSTDTNSRNTAINKSKLDGSASTDKNILSKLENSTKNSEPKKIDATTKQSSNKQPTTSKEPQIPNSNTNDSKLISITKSEVTVPKTEIPELKSTNNET